MSAFSNPDPIKEPDHTKNRNRRARSSLQVDEFTTELPANPFHSRPRLRVVDIGKSSIKTPSTKFSKLKTYVKDLRGRLPNVNSSALLSVAVGISLVYTAYSLNSMTYQIETLRSDLASANATITKLQQNDITLDKKVDALSTRLETSDKKLSTIETATTGLSSTANALLTRIESLESLQKELTSYKQKLTSLITSNKTSSAQPTKTQPRSGTTAFSTPLKGDRTFQVSATAYTARCKGCSGVTATGIDVRRSTPKIIAVDPKVIPLKSKVELFRDGKSLGVYSAEDTGGAIKGNKIDILFASNTEALNFGRRTLTARVLN